MTKADIIQSMKEAWTRALMDERELTDDLAESYSSWVQGLVKAAAPDLQGQAAASNGGQQQGAQQGGQQQGAQQGGQQMPQAAPQGGMQ